MNKIEQILVLLLFLPVLHAMAEDNNGLMLDNFNANGSLVADKSRGIAYITYDLNNNPKQIYFTNGSVTKYVYSAAGQKLRVVHYAHTGTVPLCAYFPLCFQQCADTFYPYYFSISYT